MTGTARQAGEFLTRVGGWPRWLGDDGGSEATMSSGQESVFSEYETDTSQTSKLLRKFKETPFVPIGFEVPQLEEVVKVLSVTAETPKKPLRREKISCVHPESFPLIGNCL
ncbi:HIG1 domain family member 1A, mitochondrial isoform X2 [Egretta garzetta]|uniref:HIG1 domain family member 1A, mitochondrial isoform X2 n=1 Tax=Egretta garzetta TaxID=188379 RepID=UPI00163C1AE9|nr:HIG1 domain family member 1A, mitochondrial isoform X2 [Egretta garzetta]